MAPERPTVVLPLRTWLAGSHAAVFLLPLAVVLGTGALGTDLRNQTRDDIEHQAAILALHASSRLQTGATIEGAGLSPMLAQVRERTLAGIQVTDTAGLVVASSGSIGDDLAGDPDVQSALQGKGSSSVRPRKASHHPLSSESRRAGVRLFVAAPIWQGDTVAGAVVVSRTPREELQAMYHMAGAPLLVGWFAGLFVAIGVGAYFSVMLSRNLRRLDQGALQIASGSFGGLGLLERPTGSHVAEVARVAGSVTAMAARLQERLGYIGEFASNVSHEFKTPLATLRGTVELLGDDEGMPEEQRARFLSNAERELVRLERLVTGLLTLARADEEPAVTEVDLDALARRVATRIGVGWEGTCGPVAGDVAQLEAVLSNLVHNALRHGGDGVTVVVRGLGGGVVEVHDDGVGISEANLSRVFDRFFTTDRAEGTGLGLALVRAVVESHGGRLTVTSRPGDTRFVVTLPPYRRSS